MKRFPLDNILGDTRNRSIRPVPWRTIIEVSILALGVFTCLYAYGCDEAEASQVRKYAL